MTVVVLVLFDYLIIVIRLCKIYSFRLLGNYFLRLLWSFISFHLEVIMGISVRWSMGMYLCLALFLVHSFRMYLEPSGWMFLFLPTDDYYLTESIVKLIACRATICWDLHYYRDKNMPKELKNWRR